MEYTVEGIRENRKVKNNSVVLSPKERGGRNVRHDLVDSTNMLLAVCDSVSLVNADFYRNQHVITDKIIGTNPVADRKEIRIPIEKTFEYVCKNLDTNMITALARRQQKGVRAKAITAVLLNKQHSLPTGWIAKHIGRMNHTTVLNYFIEMDRDKRIYNPLLNSDWLKIKRLLNIDWDFTYKTNRKQ